MNYTNYHSHCHYCDGKEAPEVHVQEAIRQGMLAYGFSSHAPLPYELPWPMAKADRGNYVQEIQQLKEQYAGQIEIYRGLEIDYIPEVAGPSRMKEAYQLDYTVGSVHFVEFFADGHPWEIDGRHQVFQLGLGEIFANDVKAAIRRYYSLIRQMVREDPPDIVGHLDKIKIQSEEGQLFSENNDWYQDEVRKTLDAIAEAGLIVEINTRGMYKKLTDEPYPSYWVIKEMYDRNIPIMLNSDSHRPQEITSNFAEVTEQLLSIGYDQMRILYQGDWQDVALTQNGLKV